MRRHPVDLVDSILLQPTYTFGWDVALCICLEQDNVSFFVSSNSPFFIPIPFFVPIIDTDHQ